MLFTYLVNLCSVEKWNKNWIELNWIELNWIKVYVCIPFQWLFLYSKNREATVLRTWKRGVHRPTGPNSIGGAEIFCPNIFPWKTRSARGGLMHPFTVQKCSSITISTVASVWIEKRKKYYNIKWFCPNIICPGRGGGGGGLPPPPPPRCLVRLWWCPKRREMFKCLQQTRGLRESQSGDFEGQ